MLGAYWFLISLFWESLLFGLIIWVKHKTKFRYFDLIAVVLLFLVGYYAPIDLLLNREMDILPIFYLGYWAGTHKMDFPISRSHLLIALSVCLPLLCYLATFMKVDVGQGKFYNSILFLVGSLAGIYLMIILSGLINSLLVGRWLDIVGGGYNDYSNIPFPVFQAINVVARRSRNVSPRNFVRMACT